MLISAEEASKSVVLSPCVKTLDIPLSFLYFIKSRHNTNHMEVLIYVISSGLV